MFFFWLKCVDKFEKTRRRHSMVFLGKQLKNFSIVFYKKIEREQGLLNMTRIKRGNIARKRRKHVLKLAKGFRGSSSKLFRTAQQQTMKALSNSYRDRQQKKREFCGLWITRLNAVARFYGFNYNKFRHNLKKAGIQLNRKVLSQVAISDEKAFKQLILLIKN